MVFILPFFQNSVGRSILFFIFYFLDFIVLTFFEDWVGRYFIFFIFSHKCIKAKILYTILLLCIVHTFSRATHPKPAILREAYRYRGMISVLWKNYTFYYEHRIICYNNNICDMCSRNNILCKINYLFSVI